MIHSRTHWYTKLQSLGYRGQLPFSKLLEFALEGARSEPALLRQTLADSRIGLLAEFQREPNVLAYEIAASVKEHDLSLSVPENHLALETNVLAFVAGLAHRARAHQSLLLDTYFGRVVREFLSQLRAPEHKQLAWWLHQSICGESAVDTIARLELAGETMTWPEMRECAVLVAALQTVATTTQMPDHLRPALVKLTTIFSALADGGVPGLFLTYMMAVSDRTQLWCRTKSSGHRGPMQSLCDDVAAPILMWRGDPLTPHRRSSQRPLHVARHSAITGRHWCRQGEPWTLSSQSSGSLLEFGEFALASC